MMAKKHAKIRLLVLFPATLCDHRLFDKRLLRIEQCRQHRHYSRGRLDIRRTVVPRVVY